MLRAKGRSSLRCLRSRRRRRRCGYRCCCRRRRRRRRRCRRRRCRRGRSAAAAAATAAAADGRRLEGRAGARPEGFVELDGALLVVLLEDLADRHLVELGVVPQPLDALAHLRTGARRKGEAVAGAGGRVGRGGQSGGCMAVTLTPAGPPTERPLPASSLPPLLPLHTRRAAAGVGGAGAPAQSPPRHARAWRASRRPARRPFAAATPSAPSGAAPAAWRRGAARRSARRGQWWRGDGSRNPGPHLRPAGHGASSVRTAEPQSRGQARSGGGATGSHAIAPSPAPSGPRAWFWKKSSTDRTDFSSRIMKAPSVSAKVEEP